MALSRMPLAIILSLALLLGSVLPAVAKMPCPAVLDAVKKAGPDKKPEEVAAELGIPPRRIKACTRKAGETEAGAKKKDAGANKDAAAAAPAGDGDDDDE